jgi:hypothetical protein
MQSCSDLLEGICGFRDTQTHRRTDTYKNTDTYTCTYTYAGVQESLDTHETLCADTQAISRMRTRSNSRALSGWC